MKKLISALLATVMLFSALPMTGFAEEENAPNDSVAETTASQEEMPGLGTEASIGNTVFYIEDGNLLRSQNNSRPQTVDDSVSWVIVRDNKIYWSKLEEHNTSTVYFCNATDTAGEAFQKVFVPVEAFDVSGDELYYLYNGEIVMVNTQTGKEESMGMFDCDAFYLENDTLKTITYPKDTALLMQNALNAYECEGDDMVSIAQSQYGYHEGNNNDNKYAIELKNAGYPAANNQAWCAYFASWCAMKAGILGKELSFSAVATPSDFGVKGYSLKQCFSGEYTPKYGDLIFYGSTPTGNQYGAFPYHGNHVGIVSKDGIFSGGKLSFSTIEGNFNDKVDTRNRCIGSNGYVSNNYYIIGFGSVGNTKKPSVSNGGTTKPSSPSKPNVPKTDTSIKVNITDCPGDNFIARSYTLRGTITSNYPITWVTAWLKNTTTGETISYYNDGWNSKRINFAGSVIDRAMRFDQCVTPGTYELAVGAANSAGVSGIYDKKYFTVKGADLKQPQFSVSSLEEGQRVRITSPDGGYVRYNLNGGYGGEGDSITKDLTTPGTYNFYAWETKNGYNDSPAITRSVSVQKVGTPSISDVKYGANSAWVTISGDGDIHYTMNGSNPNKNSSSYNGTIYLYDSTTIKAMASSYGKVNSDISSKYISISAPDTPTGLKLYNTKEKIAQGKTATVRWNAADRATKYEARLYYNGEQVGRAYETNGTTAAFKLSEVGTYTVKVKAINFKGASAECDGVTVESMAPVTVTFVDRILREDNVTDEVVSQIQQNVYEHGDSTEIEGNVISVQKIDYDTKPNIPSWEDKKGFSRQYFGGEAYTNILEDTTVYAYYSVRSYNVSFWNYWTYDSTHNAQIGQTQNIMYSFSAEAPTDFEMPTGYALAGWNVDAKVSDGFDFTFVDGNIKLYTSYGWENEDLPVILEITGAKRGNTCQSYEVNMRYINNNLKDTQARIIMSLYTSDGRMVYTATEDVDLMSRDPGIYYTETIQATYPDKISKISAVMVGVKDGRTGGAVSKMVSTTDIETPNDGTTWTAWSEWSTTNPGNEPARYNDVKGLAREVEQKTQYRYRNKAYTTSSSNSLWGWNLYDTRRTAWGATVGPVYYDPRNNARNAWSESYVTSSNYKTVYHYYRYANNWSGGYGAATAKYPNYYTYDFDYELPRYTGNYGYKWYWGSGSGDWNTVWRADYLGNAYTTQQWVSDNYGTRWYYQEPVYTYYFWKWNDWSGWSDSSVSGDETQTRTVYRWRDNFSNYPGYDPSRDSSLEEETKEKYELSGNIPGLSKDYNGKLATVLVYKKTNTDPTQEQLEYVDQITVGENNSYSFTVNPKEEISEETGDYIVTLSMEGSKNLSNIDVIKAPVPQCTVTFRDANGNILNDADGNEWKVTIDKGGSIDAYDVPIPHKDGYRFLKWNTSLVNITSDITVSPLFDRETYNVVFVDYENQTADMVEVKYGDPIVLPEVEPVEGKEFIGWDAECYKYATEGNVDTDIFNIKEENPYYQLTDGSYILTTDYDSAKHNIVDETLYYKYVSEKNTTITESKIISAKWRTNEYTVRFCGFDGNVIDDELVEQKVKYGESAQPPAALEKDGVICPWSLDGGEWWNVTQDMIITPYVPQTVQVDAPTISAPTTNAYGEYRAELETSAEDSKIYYTLDCGITESDVRKFVEMQKEVDTNETEESSAEQTNSVSLMSNDSDATTELPTEVDGSDEYNENVMDYIEEYTNPISLYAGNVVYAFTVDKDGNISPISVFQYDNNITDEMLGDASNEYVPDSDVPQITMSTINAKPGETVTVPVKIKNNMGITNLSMILGYDAEDLTLDGVENGDVFADSEFASDIREDGSCKFTWKTETDNSNDGTLMNLTFTVKSEADKSKYMLDLRVEYSGDENDEEWYFVTVPGALTGEEKLDGTLGDVNVDGEVDFADAILVIKYDAGLQELNENQLLLGDVNGDGEVDFSDAILIIKYDAGLISGFKK